MAKTIHPTVGHHFGDFLMCKQKAWLHYHGDPRKKMPPPINLRVMQAEGQRLETAIYKSRYEGAYKVPGIATDRRLRLEKTKEAMQRGEPAILQGYVETPLGNGTPDVMELVGLDPGSSVGHAYRVGEIKRSQTLMTAHIMQVSWYTELLEQTYNQKVTEGFFLLGTRNTQPHTENLQDHVADYKILKSALFELRDTTAAPGAHLIPACTSCDWRGVCMPNLIDTHHISLLPTLTPNHVASLHSLGHNNWQDIEQTSDPTLLEIGLSPFDIEMLRDNLKRLHNGLPPLKHQFRKDLLAESVAVSMNFPNISTAGKDKKELRPTSIYWYAGIEPHTIKILYSANAPPQINSDELLSKSLLVFFGGTDIGAFTTILKHSHHNTRPKLFDIFQFIDQNVHAPIPGLELRNIIQYINKQEIDQTGQQRAWAINQVISWISASLLCSQTS